MLLLNLIQVTESISRSVVPLALFCQFCALISSCFFFLKILWSQQKAQILRTLIFKFHHSIHLSSLWCIIAINFTQKSHHHIEIFKWPWAWLGVLLLSAIMCRNIKALLNFNFNSHRSHAKELTSVNKSRNNPFSSFDSSMYCELTNLLPSLHCHCHCHCHWHCQEDIGSTF